MRIVEQQQQQQQQQQGQGGRQSSSSDESGERALKKGPLHQTWICMGRGPCQHYEECGTAAGQQQGSLEEVTGGTGR